jgi:hypothetical protein
MTNQNTSPAALRKTAIIFASLCCSAAAVGTAAPLFASTSEISVAGVNSGASQTAYAAVASSGNSTHA